MAAIVNKPSKPSPNRQYGCSPQQQLSGSFHCGGARRLPRRFSLLASSSLYLLQPLLVFSLFVLFFAKHLSLICSSFAFFLFGDQAVSPLLFYSTLANYAIGLV